MSLWVKSGKARQGRLRANSDHWSKGRRALTKRVLEQLTNIHYTLGSGLDERRSSHVGVRDPTNNKQS